MPYFPDSDIKTEGIPILVSPASYLLLPKIPGEHPRLSVPVDGNLLKHHLELAHLKQRESEIILQEFFSATDFIKGKSDLPEEEKGAAKEATKQPEATEQPEAETEIIPEIPFELAPETIPNAESDAVTESAPLELFSEGSPEAEAAAEVPTENNEQLPPENDDNAEKTENVIKPICKPVPVMKIPSVDVDDTDLLKPTVTSLLTSLQTLQSKISSKDQLIQCLADQLISLAEDGYCWTDSLFHCIASYPPKRYVDFDCAMLADYLAGYVYYKPTDITVNDEEPGHPLSLNIIGATSFDSLLISWNIPKDCEASAFDIYVNDELIERMRDSEARRALLHPLVMQEEILITVCVLDNCGLHALCDEICISPVSVPYMSFNNNETFSPANLSPIQPITSITSSLKKPDSFTKPPSTITPEPTEPDSITKPPSTTTPEPTEPDSITKPPSITTPVPTEHDSFTKSPSTTTPEPTEPDSIIKPPSITTSEPTEPYSISKPPSITTPEPTEYDSVTKPPSTTTTEPTERDSITKPPSTTTPEPTEHDSITKSPSTTTPEPTEHDSITKSPSTTTPEPTEHDSITKSPSTTTPEPTE